MSNIEKIRAEIERLAKRADRRTDKDHASHNAEMERYGEDYWNGYDDAFVDLLYFLDTLSEEPDKGLDVTNFCKPVDPGIAQCVADHWWEMLGDKEPDKSLEEAAEKSSTQYYKDAGYSPFPNVETAAHKSGFIAGAKWGIKSQEKMIADAYEKGKQEGIRVVRSWESSPGQGGY